MERKIICPAIYKHFKDKYYAVIGISKPLEYDSLIEIAHKENQLLVQHTEVDIKFGVFMIENEIYHNKNFSYGEFVIYKSLYDNHIAYARPLEMFTGEVPKDREDNITGQTYRFEEVPVVSSDTNTVKGNVNKFVRVKEKYAFTIIKNFHYGEVLDSTFNVHGEKEIQIKVDLLYSHDSIIWILEEYYEYIN